MPNHITSRLAITGEAAEGGTTEYSRGYSDALKRIFGKEILDNNSK